MTKPPCKIDVLPSLRDTSRPVFEIGGLAWTVRLARSIRFEGAVCYGRATEANALIQIASSCPTPRRLGVLIHELTHAYTWTFGFPRDEEALCDFCAAVACQSYRDLLRCGGFGVLERMRIGDELREVVDHPPLRLVRD
jgi:hypothetical protein